MSINRYDPFGESLSLRRAIDELFERSFVTPSWMRGTRESMAPMDVHESDQGYNVRVSLPGVKPEDIEVTVQNNTLTVRGHYSSSTPQQGLGATQGQGLGATQGQSQQGNWVMREISTGSFERSVTFPRPINADQIQSSYEHGILTLNIPLSEASRPRRINVSGGQSQLSQVSVDSGSSQSQSSGQPS